MEYFFYPTDENEFKEMAFKNKFVRTLIFDTSKQSVKETYCREVSKVWEQTRKNNIQTDHRVKELIGDHYQIYSWIVENESDFGLPFFSDSL